MRPRSIAVLGGGTAGWMAAAHLSRNVPEARLLHVWDPTLPAIGVGEGTLPAFPPWLHSMTGFGFEELESRCHATYKLGVRFEGWGRRKDFFFHNFAAGSYAYHLSAVDLPAVLDPAVRVQTVNRRIAEVSSTGRRATLVFTEGDSLDVDFVVDARGFPEALVEDGHLELTGIPTDTAAIRRVSSVTHQGGTRAVARPHGWIFAIPLATHTSFGYLANSTLSTPELVREDFDAFFREESLEPEEGERRLSFPSFRRRRFFDGALFHIGNSASFLEPLEATAIGIILLQLQMMTWWLRDELVGIQGEERWLPEVLEEINRDIGDTIDSVGLFVAWHYSAGSVFDTPFWRHARRGYERAHRRHRESRAGVSFRRLARAAERIPSELLPRVRNQRIYQERLAPLTGAAEALSGFDEISFAQVGHGLGILGREESTQGKNRGIESPATDRDTTHQRTNSHH